MAQITKISWCDATWSPWEGCTKVSPGCANCYADERDKRHLHGPASHFGPGKPRRLTKDWDKPHRWNHVSNHDGNRRIRVFPSLCDWLDDEVPVEWLWRFMNLIQDTPNLDWLLLTKRPENWESRLRKVLSNGDPRVCERWLNGQPPRNVALGVSAEDHLRAEARIPALLKIPARLRFLSCEPLLGPIDLLSISLGDGRLWSISGTVTDQGWPESVLKRIDWVIVGGESGRGARSCDQEWIRSIRCQSRGVVPLFVKQMGSNSCQSECDGVTRPRPLADTKGSDFSEWAPDLRVQERPIWS